jgi:hypothetical protein
MNSSTRNTQDKASHESKKWTLFTYYSPQVRNVTNLFRQTDVLIAFHNINSTCDTLRLKTTSTIDEYIENGTVFTN